MYSIDLSNEVWLGELAELKRSKAGEALRTFMEANSYGDVARLGDKLFSNDIGWEIFLEAELGEELEGELVGAFTRVHSEDIQCLRAFTEQLLTACAGRKQQRWASTALEAILRHEDENLREGDFRFVIDSSGPEDASLSRRAKRRLGEMF